MLPARTDPLTPSTAATDPRSVPGTAPVLLYDGTCAFCRAQAARARRWAGTRVRVVPLQTALAEFPWVDAEGGGRAVLLIDRYGHRYAGAAAVVHLVRIVRPGLAPLLALYRLPLVRALAERVYDFVAVRRYRLGTAINGPCGDGTCGRAG